VRRAQVPIFQNVVYPTRLEALAAPQGELVLGTCVACGFSYNARFDAELVVYDERYDNHVASAAFEQYYRTQARLLIDRFKLASGTVYDVGCGKGEFLRILCALAPGIHGVGIDPSCTPLREGNFELVRAHFDKSLFGGDAKLVILRHVLEHISEPIEFLGELRRAMPDTPLYVEVPDLDWIWENGAFWDFCYEHCNYFTLNSLSNALSRAGFAVLDQQLSFVGQYQWALCLPTDSPQSIEVAPEQEISKATRFSENEAQLLERIEARAIASSGIAIWGMATKGVILATLLDARHILGGIDMNPAKQGHFAAGSGIAIHPVDWVKNLPMNSQILVMNSNYLEEIRDVMLRVRPDIQLSVA
jgi:SAM-dependent methyltransferase